LSAEKTAKKTFEENSLGENLPSVDIKLNNENSSINIVDLIILSKIEGSKSEIRRLIKGKGVRINNEIIIDEKFLIQKKSFDNNSFLKLSIGKKKHLKIKLA
ncbi:MAG: tyrosine--tRNA ligase, partial [Pelagibacterales bacterium]|nr:tyrosine--tRNA ligase [Pelagibacterales bacterium]